MAAPMTPASPLRDQEVMQRENAIKKRLNAANQKNKIKATGEVAADMSAWKKKHPKGGTHIASKNYTTQGILGADKGYSKSDYGVDQGAAIPYEIGTTNHTVSKVSVPWGKGKGKPSMPTPKRPAGNPGGILSQPKLDAIRRRTAGGAGSVNPPTPIPGNVIPIGGY